MSTLFDASDLSGYLRREVSDEDADVVELMVWGWLSPALGLSERPDPVPDNVFSWALELAAIAYENPSGGSKKTLGSLSVEFPSERVDSILEKISRTATTAPRGSFPPASRWPDPVRCW